MKTTSIRLEASSHCQLRCPSCPTTTGAIHPAIGSGFLALGDFEALLQANPQLRQIELSNYGEIFLNPAMVDIFRVAHERGVALNAGNGVNLNQASGAALEALVKYQVRSLSCSIDGASQASYAKYRVRGDFDTVLANVRRINAYKRAYGSRYPRLAWQFVAFGHNQQEVPAARALAADLGMEFRLKLSWDAEFSPLQDLEGARRELGGATRAEYRERRGEDYMEAICHQLWDEPQINWDGKLLGCSRNFWGDFGPANAFKDGLDAALAGEKLEDAKALLLGRGAPRADIPCSSCAIYLERKSAGRRLRRPLPPYRWLRRLWRWSGLGRLRAGLWPGA
ncbi:MAG TPA: radical SAM protein [bacterium]|nr:radical SAM protein [bacterium]